MPTRVNHLTSSWSIEIVCHLGRSTRCAALLAVLAFDSHTANWKAKCLELPMIRVAVGPVARITYVLSTRDKIRIFPRDRTGQDSKGNPRAGLAVDSGISSEQLMEFHLQSQAAISGMPQKVRYIVLKDSTSQHAVEHTLDALAQMTYHVTVNCLHASSI